MSNDDNLVNTFVARRVLQRKQAGEDPYATDSVLQAADEITELYGRLSTRLSATDTLAAIHLAERALYTVLTSAVGVVHAADIEADARQRAARYELQVSGVPPQAAESMRNNIEENGDNSPEGGT
jgi:hypothetical protein